MVTATVQRDEQEELLLPLQVLLVSKGTRVGRACDAGNIDTLCLAMLPGAPTYHFVMPMSVCTIMGC
jgi:hypothetical protein